ncbi:uncharacterized protein CELE_M02A10.1 [Caenorhabditis elegans]|uniref:Uncharacterized protein n=1 Tax=Caenorhabditis elegans TaxID=6239 RepID=Q21459_CAEEL|nr:Uncharacterized protein CELE_M02A10.1 [Caenorhabditis elegans]CCD62720.1 Uncharacterized protein CELE_M02A10.1 [Caenorhabditis elegans]|eukprot:NP_508144.1 Uncharacterized protein CELE_M02A10.1 [Caenorhabditis elegans]
MELPQIEYLNPLSLDQIAIRKSSFSTQSTSTQAHSETELHPSEEPQKKRRTVTFGNIDITELNYQATKIPPEQRRQWKRQAIRRRIEKREFYRRIKMGFLKGCIIFLLFTLCSLIVLLATAQGTGTKLNI